MRDWRTEPLECVAEIRSSNVDKKSNRGEEPVLLCNYMDVYLREYITEDIDFMEATATVAETQRFRIERGDLMITKDSETPDDIGIPTVVVDEIPNLVCGYHVALIKPNRDEVDPVYLAPQLAATGTARYFGRLANGSTRYGLSYQSIAQTPVRLAPLPQQQRIAEILSTVDEAIEQTEALIAKTQQIKAGLMHDLFTRGVTADGQLRPPREEAPRLYKESPLGWIPTGWEIAELGECLSSIDAGKSPDCPDIPAAIDQWGVLKVGAVNPEGFRSDENKVVLNPSLHNPAYLVNNGDLLLSRANTVDLVGIVCHVQQTQPNLMLSDKTLRFRVQAGVMDVRYLFWVMQLPASRRQLENLATGTSGSMKNISQASLRTLLVMDADNEEQKRIAARLDAICDKQEALRHELSQASHLKRALMQDLLTGRIPVAVDTPIDLMEAPANV